jgi:integrase
VSAPAASTTKPAPSITLLLAPLTRGLAEPERPAFLARLERLAAERYRAWAEQSPAHGSVLRACAASEEEIAGRADRLFPMSEAQRAKLDALLPEARRLYGALFVGLSLREQLQLQAAAELQGANVWRAIAAAPGLPHALREALAACAALEEESAARLEQLLREWRP